MSIAAAGVSKSEVNSRLPDWSHSRRGSAQPFSRKLFTREKAVETNHYDTYLAVVIVRSFDLTSFTNEIDCFKTDEL